MDNLEAEKAKNFDLKEKTLAVFDTLGSLNPKVKGGHSQSYWAGKGNKEAEFIAHSFENAFASNDYFKQAMPDLYKDMIKMIEDIKP